MREVLARCVYLIEPGTRRRWLALIGLALLTSIVEAVGALLILSLLEYVAGEGALRLPLVGELADRFPSLDDTVILQLMAAVTAVFFLGRGGLYIAQSYAQNRVAYRTSARLSVRLLRGYMTTPWPDFLRRSSSEMIRNAHEGPLTLAQSVLAPAVALVSESFMLLAVLAVLAVTAPTLTLVTGVGIALVMLVLLRVLAPALQKYGRLSQDVATASLRSLQQVLQGMRDIRLFGREDSFEDAFSRNRFEVARVNYLRTTLVDGPRVTLETVVVLILLGYIAASSALGSADDSTLRTLGIFAYGVMRALPSLNRLMGGVNGLRYGRGVIDDLYQDAVAADKNAAAAAERRSVAEISFRNEIRVEHVSVRYPGALAPAVRDVSFTITRGEAVGLVGPTGGGKSTIVDVVTGLLEPFEGRVTVDGQVVSDDPRAWQAKIGVVPQTPFLLDDTLVRNIALGVPVEAVDWAALEEAVDLAQLRPVVDRLPQGLESVLGDRGHTLSGGERQRVSISRALYRRPEVVVLDEGTSALDTITESAFIEALSALRGDRTIIAVAHRLSTVRDCDRLHVVADGAIVETGTYDELASNGAVFRLLVPHG